MDCSTDPSRPVDDHPTARQSSRERRQSLFGSLSLFLGMGILALLLADGAAGLPINMPRSWYVDRAFWVLAGLLSVGLGWRLLRERDEDSSLAKVTVRRNRPQEPSAPRFERVVLYTRPGCHLCDAAREMLEKYRDVLPPPLEIDIDSDPALASRHGTCIPVVEIDGKVRFRGQIHELLLRRLIAATPPRIFENSSPR